MTVSNDKVRIKDEILMDGQMVMTDNAEKRKLIGVLERINPFTGNVLSRQTNDIIIPGSNYILEKMWNRRSTFGMSTISDDLGINTNSRPTQNNLKDEIIFGFVLGNGGVESADLVRAVKFKDKSVNAIFPIRVVDMNKDLQPLEQAKYAMKKQVGTKYVYYAKLFETDTVIRNLFTDGTEIPPNIDQMDTSLGLLVYAESIISINNVDCREWYMEQFGTIDNCRFNSVGLVAGFLANDDYAGVRTITKINMNNMSLNDMDQSYTYTYRVYCI